MKSTLLCAHQEQAMAEPSTENYKSGPIPLALGVGVAEQTRVYLWQGLEDQNEEAKRAVFNRQ